MTAEVIVTFNQRDFGEAAEKFNLKIMMPADFYKILKGGGYNHEPICFKVT